MDGPTEIAQFVPEVASANFVSVNSDGQPLATLMPCTWMQDPTPQGPAGTLFMHMARANKQWASIINGSRALAIVQGPQAYISPSSYASKLEDGKVVPTWNYTAVQLSGTVTVSHDTDYLLEIVTHLTDLHETGRAKPWQVSDAPDSYIQMKLRGIVAITLQVDLVEAKAKLNQNRSIADQKGVSADLEHSGKSGDQAIAKLMKLRLETDSL